MNPSFMPKSSIKDFSFLVAFLFAPRRASLPSDPTVSIHVECPVPRAPRHPRSRFSPFFLLDLAFPSASGASRYSRLEDLDTPRDGDDESGIVSEHRANCVIAL